MPRSASCSSRTVSGSKDSTSASALTSAKVLMTSSCVADPLHLACHFSTFLSTMSIGWTRAPATPPSN
eukprot:2236112-Pyramimonas_sp.AAC.1